MDRSEAIKVLSDLSDQCCQQANIFCTTDADKICEAIDMAIEALERYSTKGCWENRESVQVDEDGYHVATCSICGSEITLEYPYDNYCPNCGTWMHGEVEWE